MTPESWISSRNIVRRVLLVDQPQDEFQTSVPESNLPQKNKNGPILPISHLRGTVSQTSGGPNICTNSVAALLLDTACRQRPR
jgi:hypothetical protein